jgi:hypothetical protein
MEPPGPASGRPEGELRDIRAASSRVTPHFAELNAGYIGASYDTLPDMVRYRRNFVAGGTYFFTATLVDRKLCKPTGQTRISLALNPGYGFYGFRYPSKNSSASCTACRCTASGA